MSGPWPADAKKHDAQGIICGHIHHAAIHDDFGIRYVNCGDWVESCTAIAEHQDGRLEIIHWRAESPEIEIPEFSRSPGGFRQLGLSRAAGLDCCHGLGKSVFFR